MYDYFDIGKVLVICPLRVCNSVWEAEAKEWEHTKDLTFVNLSGGRKNMLKGLQRKGDIYLINRENVAALVKEIGVRKWDFDMIVIDESSSFKSHASKRFKALKHVTHKARYMVLLTGTPAPNGYMDLWSQIYLLDGGERLGRTIGLYRQRYFTPDFFGHNYTIKTGAMCSIEESIQDLVLSMSAEDYLELPDFVPSVLGNKLEGRLLAEYKKLEKEMMVQMESGADITAVSAATLSNKLLQFCSGNMYDENGKVHHVHDIKIDTLKEIIEENPNENILVAYNYKHELEALLKAFPQARQLDKDPETVKDWNEGKIPLLLAQHQSASMGINLQHGGSLIVWYGFTFNLESYLQFNKRLHRQGQKDVVRCLHIAVGDVEERLMKRLAEKEITQARLLEVLK